uniref:G_PROTEIN_RECEP_F1_2 domain-containing protein n=1 Tax=Strongyloides papillosus TaxID=174720 RepID=A0A0N5B8B6_STREA
MAIIFVEKYESFNPVIPYFGICCHVLSYIIYGIQRAILLIYDIYEESILVEICVLMFIVFCAYLIIFKKQKSNIVNQKSAFIEVNLSTKYQFIENQKTYSIVTGLLLLFAVFTVTTNVIKILFTSVFVNVLKPDASNYIFFMGVFFKTAGTITYLLWKIPSLLKDLKKILKINTKNDVNNIAGRCTNDRNNKITPRVEQNDYFNQYKEKW